MKHVTGLIGRQELIEKITRELESDAALRTHVLQLREALLTE